MEQRKLSRPTDQRMAILRNQVTHLLWYGKMETTYEHAKEVQRIAEKLLTKAIGTYLDVEKKVVTRKNKKGKDTQIEVVNDGVKKLAARRAIMRYVYNIPEPRLEEEGNAAYRTRTGHIKYPLIEKIFNELAPKYDERAKTVGSFGGYVRVLKTETRRGDAAQMALIELV